MKVKKRYFLAAAGASGADRAVYVVTNSHPANGGWPTSFSESRQGMRERCLKPTFAAPAHYFGCLPKAPVSAGLGAN